MKLHSGFDEYSFGDNRRFYKTVMPNSPGWNNPENPYLTNTAKPAVAKVGHKTGPYPSYGSPEYIQAHPEYTPPKPRIPTFAGGGEFAPIPEKDSLYIEDRLKKDPYLSAKYKYKVVEDRKKGDILYRTMPNGKDVPVNFNNMKELDRQAYKVKMDRDLQSTGQKPIYNVFAPPTFKHGGMKLPKYYEGDIHMDVPKDPGLAPLRKPNEPVASAADQQQIDNGNNRNNGMWQAATNTALGVSSAYYNNNKARGPQDEYYQQQFEQGKLGYNEMDKSGIDQTLASIPGYGQIYAGAKAASNLGRSAIKKDEYGMANSASAQATDQLMKPMHDQAIDDIKAGNYGDAAGDMLLAGFYKPIKTYLNYDKDKSKVEAAKKDIIEAPLIAEQNRKNNLYHTYAQGGVHSGMPNAEVEKEEVMRMPNGQTKQVDGPSHENGGVPVNIPDGTQIFSDRLKDPTTKKTFAKMAEQYKTNKQDKILNNPKADKTAKSTAELVAQIKQAKLDKLFETQEQLKQTRLNKYAQKLGLDPSSFTNGGTKLPKFTNGAFVSLDPKNLQLAQQAQSGLPPMEQVEDPSFNDNAYYPIPFMKPSEAERLKNERPNSKQQYIPNPNDPYEQAMAAGKEFEQPAKQGPPGKNKYDWIEPAANTLMQNAGNLAYLAGEGKKYDKQQFYKYNPELYNPADALRQADIEARVTRDRLKDASGGNAGALMSNLQQSQAINTLGKSKIRTDASNMNNQIMNDAQLRNIQGKYQVDDINARNKGQALTNYYKAIQGIGTNTSAAYADWKRGDVDEQTLKLISNKYPDYTYDKKKKGWYHKSTGKKLE